MVQIVISYRKDDQQAQAIATQFCDELTANLEDSRVVLGVSGLLQAGDDYVEAIENRIRATNGLILLIGNNWTSDWLQDSEDYDHIALRTALQEKLRIIPVLIGGRSVMPSADMLPQDFASITRRSPVTVRETNVSSDIQSIASVFRKSIDGSVITRSSARTDAQPTVIVAETPIPTSPAEKPNLEVIDSGISLNEGIGWRMVFNGVGYKVPNTKTSRNYNAALQEIGARPIDPHRETVILHIGIGSYISPGIMAQKVIFKNPNGSTASKYGGTWKGELIFTNQRIIAIRPSNLINFIKPMAEGTSRSIATLFRFDPFEYQRYSLVTLYGQQGDVVLEMSFVNLTAVIAGGLRLLAGSRASGAQTELDYTKALNSKQEMDQAVTALVAQTQNLKNAFYRFLLFLCQRNAA